MIAKSQFPLLRNTLPCGAPAFQMATVHHKQAAEKSSKEPAPLKVIFKMKSMARVWGHSSRPMEQDSKRDG